MKNRRGDIWKDDGPESYVRRAQILVRNAERTLKSLKVVKGFIRGPKRVREASGVGWLAVEEAVKVSGGAYAATPSERAGGARGRN